MEVQENRRQYFPLLVAATAFVFFKIISVDGWNATCLALLASTLVGVWQDEKPIAWYRFLPAGFITMVMFYLIYNYANPFWNNVVAWQTESVHHAYNWNETFNAIPLNDAAFLRFWQPYWLTKYFQWVYGAGFTLSYWICVIRAFFTKDVQKLGRYSLAGYLLQVPFILPMYNTILLQEVWFVQGTPDLMERGLNADQAYSTALNCFPSMHTSIAFAALLLILREKSRWYKWIAGTYCVSIIIATMYLNIHWVIDVLAGMLFAYMCVKLADWIVGARFYAAFVHKFEGVGERLFGDGTQRKLSQGAGASNTKSV